MKIIKLLALFCFIFAFSLNSYSQGNLSFNIMGALPVSDYGSDDLDNEDAGGSGIGAGIGIQYVHPIIGNGLGIFGGVDVIYNGYKKSVKDDMQAMYEGLLGTSVDVKWSKMFNVPLSFGLNFTKTNDAGAGIFANIGLTYNFFKQTNEVIGTDLGDLTMSAKMASAVGFKVGGGLKLNNKISVFANYLGLGTHDIEATMEGGGESEDFKAESKIDIITIGIGFGF